MQIPEVSTYNMPQLTPTLRQLKGLYPTLLLLCTSLALGAQQTQQAVAGKIDRIENFPSKFVEARDIDIWLPETYDGKKKFAVLYMHDGQMLFDPSTTWNQQSWNVDDVASKLMEAHKLQDFIVVGIWNTGAQRHADYFPQKPFESLSQAEKDTLSSQLRKAARTTGNFQPNSDNYLQFLVTELKPMIDRKYAVRKGRKNTFIAGSSMGGLISMYALCEYPDVFGGMACISTHWIGSFTPVGNPVPTAFVRYFNEHLPSPKTHKIYFDTGDQGLDAYYPAVQEQIDNVLKTKGYTDKNWKTQYFKGKDHSEKAWNERLDIPLSFLLGKRS